HFFLQRLSFVHGEVVAIKHVEQTGPCAEVVEAVVVRKETIGQNDIRFAPIVVCKRLKQTAVQKRNAAVESFAPGVVSAIRGKRVVEQWFQNIVEEVLVIAVFGSRQTTKKIVRSSSPILALLDPKPSFLLDEIQENNLPHELLGKVSSSNVPFVELFRDCRIFPGKLVQGFLNFCEQVRILPKEFLRNGLDAEGLFDLRERRDLVGILKQV